MDAHASGWFTELFSESGPGTGAGLSIKVGKILHEEVTKYQKITIFESETFGKCLSLDDAIQCTELDEFSYQEMIAFLALNAHPNPARVLIIGGGDGGVARECLKHPRVQDLVQCEIDERVVELSKEYFPKMASSFADPKLKLVFDDGLDYVTRLDDCSFDVIITDSSDPKGPAEGLFRKAYYKLVHKKLKSNGVICCQAQSIWFELEFIAKLMDMNREIFAQVAYASCLTCTYPSGQIGFMLCAKRDKSMGDLREPTSEGIASLEEIEKKGLGHHQLRYYSEAAHKAAFVLPKFAETRLYGRQNDKPADR